MIGYVTAFAICSIMAGQSRRATSGAAKNAVYPLTLGSNRKGRNMGRKQTVTKRPTYRDAVRWIAFNDAPGDDEDVEHVAGYISTILIADLFGAEPRAVAIDVVRTRHGAGPFADKAEAA